MAYSADNSKVWLDEKEQKLYLFTKIVKIYWHEFLEKYENKINLFSVKFFDKKQWTYLSIFFINTNKSVDLKKIKYI